MRVLSSTIRTMRIFALEDDVLGMPDLPRMPGSFSISFKWSSILRMWMGGSCPTTTRSTLPPDWSSISSLAPRPAATSVHDTMPLKQVPMCPRTAIVNKLKVFQELA